jgi:hypothetical protein
MDVQFSEQMGTNGIKLLGTRMADIWLSPHYPVGRSSGYSTLTDSNDLSKYIGATVSEGIWELCHCYTLTTLTMFDLWAAVHRDKFPVPQTQMTTNNKSHIWVSPTYSLTIMLW